MPSGIINLEGADGSGKTTLARHLVEKHGARYLHGRVWRDQTRWYAGMLRRAEWLVEAGNLVVIDRHWISELVYAPLFRGGPAWNNEVSQGFDERIRGAPGVYVLCVPLDARRHLDRFERLKAERNEAFERIESVVQRYQDLLLGNVAHPGDNLVDLFIRYGDFCTTRQVVHYDIDAQGHNLRKIANIAMELLQ